MTLVCAATLGARKKPERQSLGESEIPNGSRDAGGLRPRRGPETWREVDLIMDVTGFCHRVLCLDAFSKRA